MQEFRDLFIGVHYAVVCGWEGGIALLVVCARFYISAFWCSQFTVDVCRCCPTFWARAVNVNRYTVWVRFGFNGASEYTAIPFFGNAPLGALEFT